MPGLRLPAPAAAALLQLHHSTLGPQFRYHWPVAGTNDQQPIITATRSSVCRHGHDTCLLSIGRSCLAPSTDRHTLLLTPQPAAQPLVHLSQTLYHHIQWHRVYCTPWVSAPPARLLQRTNTADTATDAHELCLHVSPSIFSSGFSSSSSSFAPRCHRTTARLPGTAVATVSLHLSAYHRIQLHSGILTKPQSGQGPVMTPPSYGIASLAALGTQTPFCQLDLD